MRVVDSIFGDFNSLAPCGANLHIHVDNVYFEAFQLTRPVRGEPPTRPLLPGFCVISTHSPRAGRTSCASTFAGRAAAFQLTRPVRGEP